MSLVIGGFHVKRLVFDNSCHHSVIFASTFEKMEKEWDKVNEPTELIHVPGDRSHYVVGKIFLTVVPKKWPKSASKEMLFSTVNAPSSYNEILGMTFRDYFDFFLTIGGTTLYFLTTPAVGYTKPGCWTKRNT